MDDGKRHETPRSETKNFIIHSHQSKHHGCRIYFGQLSLKSTRIMEKCSGGYWAGSRLSSHLRNSELGNLNILWRVFRNVSFYDRFKQLTLCPGGKRLYHTGQQANPPFALEGITISLFQYFLLNNDPWKDNATPQDNKKCKSPIENCVSERNRGWDYGIMQCLIEFIGW